MKSLKQQLIRNKNYNLKDQFHLSLLINIKYSILYTVSNKLWFDNPVYIIYKDIWNIKNEIS
jgi:hypothetical protein